MQLVESIDGIRRWRSGRKGTIGFVPTMGALHDGHISLVRQSRNECDSTVVSIFVNPTQFNQARDLEHYPRDLESDKRLLEECEVDCLFLPTFETIYPDDYRFKVVEDEFSRELCGLNRPGHFDGVLTVVMRLFNLTRPHRAYFGEKDYQQYLLVRDMAAAFFMDVTVVPSPIVRDENGVALSSRNRRLSKSGYSTAIRFADALRTSSSVEETRTKLEGLDLSIDYLVEKSGRLFGAVVIEDVRLIDNVALDNQSQS